MTPPVLITPPAAPVVALADMKLHLRVSHTDEDSLITALEASAVAYLDGWKGVLGRAIASQVWRQEFKAGEAVRLLLPDVTAIEVTAYDDAGLEVDVDAVLVNSFQGPTVSITGSYADLRVDYTCAMDATKLPAAQAMIKLLVGHWYYNRESVAVGVSVAEMPMAVAALVTAMRWSCV